MITPHEVFPAFASLVAKSLHVPVEQVTMDAQLDDLGAESLDFLQITMEAEEQFGISISEKTILQTASEVFGPGVIERDGVLTEEGKDLLRARMPGLDPALLAGEVSVKDVNRHFLRVSSWVRMIEWLIEQTPANCAACGGALEPVVAMRSKCSQCGLQIALPSGEEINRRWVEDYRASKAGSAA